MSGDRGPITSAITIILVVLATTFVAARFFTRVWLVRSVKQDDWWILAAWIVAVGFSTAICVGVKYGLGKHRVDISEHDNALLRKAEYTFSVLYNPSLMLTKTSIVVFYLSVMSKDVDPVFKWCNWITLAVVNLAGAALTFYTIFQCSPVSAGYTFPTPTTAKCTDIVNLYLSSAPVNIITDIAILFLPMPILTGMRLPKKQKIILIVTFSFGAFVAVVDVIRLAYLQTAALDRLQKVNTGSDGTRTVDRNDFSWYASLSFMWSAIPPSFVQNTSGDENMMSRNSVDAHKPQMIADPSSVKGNVSMLNHPAAFRKPTVKEYAGEDDGDNMGFLNMLAGPDTDAPDLSRTTTNLSRINTRKSTTASDFDFVSMGSSKNMLKLTNKQSVWPIAVVTIIFFLWGFAYGLLNTLNEQFQRVVGLSSGQAVGLHSSYFCGYLFGPLTLGRFVLKGYGFKATMMAGLAVYGCGTLVFWPSAVLTSYTAFVISNFIVAFGLSCLEIAANPFIALCGPLEYAEVRLNLSQAFQAVGSICSPLLASKVLFKNITNADSLVDVQWAYLGIALFVYALAIVFYYIPLPEASDDQLEELADRRSAVYRARVGPWKVIYVTLALGVFSEWCYVGAQEGVGGAAGSLLTLYRSPSGLDTFYLNEVGKTVFAAGRFLAAFLNYILKPRWILLALYMGLIVCLALQMTLKGTAAVAMQMMTWLFEAGIFSIIYAISMRGMGAHTKTASAFMSAAISGGAIIPVIQWAVQQHHSLPYSYCVPLATAVFGMIFAVYLNVVPAARHQVDPIHERRNERRQKRALERQNSAASDMNGSASQFGLAGIIARRRKNRAEKPSVEHVERHGQNDMPTSMVGNVEKMDFADLEKPVQLKAPAGQVGALEPWPGGDGEGESSASPSEESDDVITRHRPVWEQDDDDIYDYHAAIRKM